MILKTLWGAVVALLVMWSPASFAVSAAGCATGGKMVEAFTGLHLQRKPLAEVDAFIEQMKPKPDEQQEAFYKKLARVTYGMDYASTAQARDAFIAYCLKVSPGA